MKLDEQECMCTKFLRAVLPGQDLASRVQNVSAEVSGVSLVHTLPSDLKHSWCLVPEKATRSQRLLSMMLPRHHRMIALHKLIKNWKSERLSALIIAHFSGSPLFHS